MGDDSHPRADGSADAANRGSTCTTGRPLTAEHTFHIRSIYCRCRGRLMGIVKIDDELHEEARRASTVMCRSINAQAEFWMKIGMLAEPIRRWLSTISSRHSLSRQTSAS